MADEIVATLHRKDRMIDMVLKKSIFEPWPSQFQPENPKWNVDSFRPWKNACGLNSLDNHTISQFMSRSTITEYPALNEVRSIIHNIFLKSKEMGREIYVNIQLKGSCKIELILRVHRPILTSPFGGPLLILTVLENQNFDPKFNEGIDRIFNREATNETKMTLIANADELQLLRYVLKLNSTKMAPSTWQKNSLPLRDNQRILTTFITPLYLDLPVSREEYDKMSRNIGLPTSGVKFSANGVVVDEDSRCVLCMKKSPNLKRCASCRSVIYCSVECQRSHWALHKTVCKMVKQMFFRA